MNAWDNSRHWPTCYKSQDDSRLPSGPLLDGEENSPRTLFCAGLLFGLLVIGPALCDLWSVMR